MSRVLLNLYAAILGVLTLVSLHRLWLLFEARRDVRRERMPGEAWSPGADAPRIVVQLPIYDEAFVAERAVAAAARLDYPRDRLELQVLDDSTDETAAIVDRAVSAARAGGVQARVLRRRERSGYKAGALAAGLAASDAEFAAIFDADFVPPPDFLVRTLPLLLADPGLGMVQARWAHINRDGSLLTRAQALLLDAHFGIEHRGRAAAGHCFNFNGTAGLWRRAAIDAAGGWRADTLTEDLDLSYRAQLAGYRFAYLDGLRVPGELPEGWLAFRAQQARWVRGGIQTARLHCAAVGRAAWPIGKRLGALLHLWSNAAYGLMTLLALLLPLLLPLPGARVGFDLVGLSVGTLAVLVFYGAALEPPRAGRWRELPLALVLGSGMCLANAREVLRGFGRQPAAFVRTPKRGQADSKLARRYTSPWEITTVLGELLLALHCAAGIARAVAAQRWGLIPFLGLYLCGLGCVAIGTLIEVCQRSPLFNERAAACPVCSRRGQAGPRVG